MTDAGMSGFIAASSAVLLNTIGVDAYTIAVACVGAVAFHAGATHAIGRARAMLQVVAGGIIGAIGAQAGADYFAIESRALLSLAAAFFGYAYFQIFEALARHTGGLVDGAVDRWGGKK